MGLVVKRTGLSPHVIRVWERRYRAVTPVRTAGGHRAYLEEDVSRLILLRRLTEAGHKISGIANLPTEELRGLAAGLGSGVEAGPTVGPREDRMGEMIRAVSAMDRESLQESLRRSAVELGAHASLERVIGPLTERVGEMWRDGSLNAAHEHFATVTIREFLWASIRPFSASSNSPTLIVTTPTGQLHELGAVIVGAAAADLGWRIVYLGPSLPPAEIASAAVQNKAKAVALSIIYPEDDPDLPRELEALRKYMPNHIPIIVGGRAASSYGAVLGRIGAVQPSSLSALYDELDAIRSAKVD